MWSATEPSAEESAPRLVSPSKWAKVRWTTRSEYAPDRAGEMRVVAFMQTVMAERFRRIAGTLETFQQPKLDRIFLRFAAD